MDKTKAEDARIEAGPVLGAIEDDAGEVALRVENYIPDDMKVFYSDAMIALHTENEFIFSFLQTEFPLAQNQEELKQVKTVRRKCVAQIIVNPKHAESILKVLQENLDKHAARHKK